MNREKIIVAFPQTIEEDVLVVAKVLPFRKNRSNFSEQFQINLAGEVLSIPTRIYFNEMAEEQYRLFTPRQKLILYCIYTRHWDGFLREKYVRKLHNEQGYEAWILPYLVQLTGEAVREILQPVDAYLEEFPTHELRDFLKENRPFIKTTQKRIVSYWNEYSKELYPILWDESYIGFKLVKTYKRLLFQNSGE